MSAVEEELPAPHRPRRHMWLIGMLALVAAFVGAWIGLHDSGRQNAGEHHAPPVVAGPPGAILAAGPCGQQLSRVPGEGSGPIDGGLLTTSADISPVNRPQFESVAAARRWLAGDAPVVVVRIGDQARAYPLAILQWHEVVNDTVAGRPLAITYCPLCNTAAVYSRAVAGKPVMLRASGALLSGAAVLADSAGQRLWSQATGQPVLGARAPLVWRPSDTLSLSEAAAANPALRVLARPTGGIDYNQSPYGDVARPHSMPRLFLGWVDEHLDPKTRLVGVVVHGTARAWRYSALAAAGVRNDTVAGRPVVVYRPRVTGIGDTRHLEHAPQVGAASVYGAHAAARNLHFQRAGRETMRDRETGSTWDLSGHAIAGPLAGTRLRPLRFLNTYWFAWVAFHPNTTVWPALSGTACTSAMSGQRQPRMHDAPGG